MHLALSEITVGYIEETAMTHVKKFEEKPVLFVDYIQILDPTSPRGMGKQIVDHSIKSLNRSDYLLGQVTKKCYES